MVDNSQMSDAIIANESGGRNLISPQGAIGPGQIMPDTFKMYAKPGEDIHNPADNLAVHNRIIADYMQRFHGDPARVAVAYFSGPGDVAPPGSPTPWIHNYHDVNEPVSKYVANATGSIPGTTLTSTPVSRETPSAPAAAPKPSLGQSLQKGDWQSALASLTANKQDTAGKDQPGTSALDKLAGITKPKEAPQQQQAPQMLAPQDQTPMITPAAQQLLSSTFANAAKPISWSTQPYGSDYGPQGLTLTGIPNV